MVCAAPLARGVLKGFSATGTHAGFERHRRYGEEPCAECRAAHNRWKREIYRTRPQYQANQKAWGRRRRLELYNLTQDGYDRMLAAQGGVCAICGSSEPGKGFRFHVDHDHECCPPDVSCGRCIRGLLCSLCNQGLGVFKDRPEVLETAAGYLRRFSEGQAQRGDNGSPEAQPLRPGLG